MNYTWSILQVTWSLFEVCNKTKTTVSQFVERRCYCFPQGRQRLLSACVQVCRRNLTKSAKLKFLLTMSSHSVFVFTNYDQTRQIIESNKPISVSQPVLTNQYQWINFIQWKHWFSSSNFFSPIVHQYFNIFNTCEKTFVIAFWNCYW